MCPTRSGHLKRGEAPSVSRLGMIKRHTSNDHRKTQSTSWIPRYILRNPDHRYRRGRVRSRILRSPLAPAVLLPARIADVAHYTAGQVAIAFRWLLTSREHTNFTYEMDQQSRAYLPHYLAAILGTDSISVEKYLAELECDSDFASTVASCVASSSYRFTSDREIRIGRRLGWYAIVRLAQPSLIVETGTDKGLGAAVIGRALERNIDEGHFGRLLTIDVNADSGHLIPASSEGWVTRLHGVSIEVIENIADAVDVFIHDSDHRYDYEMSEYLAVAQKLSPRAVILSDNAQLSTALHDFAHQSGRRFLYFGERAADHWIQGCGIGAAFSSTAS